MCPQAVGSLKVFASMYTSLPKDSIVVTSHKPLKTATRLFGQHFVQADNNESRSSSPFGGDDGFPSQRANNKEWVFISWLRHETSLTDKDTKP